MTQMKSTVVATASAKSERRWTRAQFLGQTCLKAGLRADAWQADATVYRFTADVFGDA